ncbi:GntR family transcriptional regulator [Pseudonocardia sp.]|uniref:GntR family transcriptional regulator n=1 Tax=Pseudonocardia sp. TaxID=60912 RepID=UPI003D134289
MAVTRLEEPSLLTDRVFTAIHEAIMSGELPAGSRLRVRDLALQVGTSVMPVREAIRRLEEAGLAERVPHKGAVVKGLTLTELEHIYDVRILLESEAARLGGAVVSPEACTRMWQLCGDITRAVEGGRIVDALNHDEAMLTLLYSAGGNPVLVEMIRGLWQRCRVYKIVGARRAVASSDETLWTFQPRIVGAARAHDSAAAATITRESLLSAKARIRDTLDAPG